ncbi:MAG: rhodanese-like domain-containing protein [Lachnospiraceae bacterium]|nr:rhodanese-like domain-containing protein [Lachnospiraceae bacterium]
MGISLKKNIRKYMATAVAAVAVIAMTFTTLPCEAATKKPTSMTVVASAKTVDIKGKSVITVKSVKPIGASKAVTFKSSNSKVAAVSAKGVVTGKKAGKVKITVTSKVNKKLKKTVALTVKDIKPTSLTLSASKITVNVGKSKTLTTIAKPAGVYCPVTFKSSNSTVAAVSKTGKITGKKAGSATITVRYAEKNKSLTKTCKVTVNPREIAKDHFQGEFLITALEAKKLIGNENVIFLDCRGDNFSSKGTIKGATATSWQALATCESKYGKAGDKNWGKVPQPAELEKKLGNLGLDKNKQIILLGETSKGWGEDARVLWELRVAGYTDLKMVDGGYNALIEAGAPTQSKSSILAKVNVKIDKLDMTHDMDTEELLKNYNEYKIVDVRTDEEYKGAIKYNEAKGGHLPGAIHLRYTDLFRKDGTLKSQAAIEKTLSDAGIIKDDQIVTYCTGGIRSAYSQIVYEMLGYEKSWNHDQSFWRWAKVGKVEK